ncbi:hypothetical protein [Kitasatospora sp. NRRL B-11411]|uniref:hypothetical protein n=1 Tax=Kitasatospora sp. NRRL B-11411 TaxID=1463822 RepID=UPI0004C3B046|nr:hypothetical protein [Kitasatospora sp. NRRL B-11411]
MRDRAIRIGTEDARVELTYLGGGEWRVTADWASALRADFTTALDDPEVGDFTARVLAGLRAPHARVFDGRLTGGRNNPLHLTIERRGPSRLVLLAVLTPNGDDGTCLLRMESGPVDAAELEAAFAGLHRSVTGG